MTFYGPLHLGLHAWLSPSGELFRVDYWEHDDWAVEYLDKTPAELELEGWLRIGDSYITNYGQLDFTEYQIMKLTSLGYVVEIYNGNWRYELPDKYYEGNDSSWYDNIPYAKGTQRWKDEQGISRNN